MKKSTFFLSLSLISVSLIGTEIETKYSHEDLVNARVAWLGQEDRIPQLIWEANNIAKNRPVRYISGGRHVANIDGITKTIETFLAQDKSIVLTYDSFFDLIDDEKLHFEAVEIFIDRADTNYLNKFLMKLYVWVSKKLHGF